MKSSRLFPNGAIDVYAILFWLVCGLAFIFLASSCAGPQVKGDFGVEVPGPRYQLVVVTPQQKNVVVGEFYGIDTCTDSMRKFSDWSRLDGGFWYVACIGLRPE